VSNPLPAELAARLEKGPVLVTGASGGIGSRLVKVLTESSVPVRVLLRHGSLAGAETARGDLTRPETLGEACSGVHILFHLASYSPAREDPRPEEHPLHRQVTVTGTANLLKAAEAAGVERIVFASSTRVLDGSTTLYAQAKRSAEALLAEAPVSTIALRLPPVYGFGKRGFVAEMVEKCLAGRLPLFPDFGDRRSLVHLDDAVQSLLLAALHPDLDGSWTVTDLQKCCSGCCTGPCPWTSACPSMRLLPRSIHTTRSHRSFIMPTLWETRITARSERIRARMASADFFLKWVSPTPSTSSMSMTSGSACMATENPSRAFIPAE